MQQIRQGANDQIKSVLNPDQQQKFTEMQERHGPGGMDHGGMGQGGMQAPPPQAPPQQ